MTDQPVKQDRRPPLKIQYQQGYMAFIRGLLSNQYNEATVMGKEWQRGFNDAYFTNLDKRKSK